MQSKWHFYIFLCWMNIQADTQSMLGNTENQMQVYILNTFRVVRHMLHIDALSFRLVIILADSQINKITVHSCIVHIDCGNRCTCMCLNEFLYEFCIAPVCMHNKNQTLFCLQSIGDSWLSLKTKLVYNILLNAVTIQTK